MGYRRLGICKFILFGNPESNASRVEIEAEIRDRNAFSSGNFVSRSWLLMLESQIGKIPKEVQEQVLSALTSRAARYLLSGSPLQQRDKTPDMRHLGTLEIELCQGNGLFVLAHPRKFDRRAPAFAVAGLIITGSVEAISNILDSKLCHDTFYALVYALQKWQTAGMPGWITAFTNTWDFDSMSDIVKQGREIFQQARSNGTFFM